MPLEGIKKSIIPYMLKKLFSTWHIPRDDVAPCMHAASCFSSHHTCFLLPKFKARKKTKVREKYVPTLLQDAMHGYENPASLHKTKLLFSSF
jgi:hypothetical protein